MSDPSAPAPETTDETEQAVAAYLRGHPRFFDRHPEVLAALEIPHHVPGTVSLVSRQVAALRSEKRRLEERLAQLTNAAEENQITLARLHALACRLFAPEPLARADLESLVAVQLDLEHARLVLSVPSPRLSDGGADHSPTPALTPLLPERPLAVCRPLPAEVSARLFGDEHEHSAAFVPLASARGWMVLAARNPERFRPGLGTLYLDWLGEMLDARLRGPS
jgi:uncharacterized protein YigA (DUF484 family)